MKAASSIPPQASRRRRTITRHGQLDEDFYSWLRDENWQEVMREPSQLVGEIREHLEAENAYTQSMLKPASDLRQEIYGELRGRIKEKDASVPAPDGTYIYYVSYVEGGQHPIYCRQKKDDAREQVLIDGNHEATSSKHFRVARCYHSPDHELIAYTVDQTGSEYYTLKIRDPISSEDIELITDTAQGDFVWASDGQTIFYTVLDEHHRPNRVLRHQLGDDPAEDVQIYQEHDPSFFVDIDKTESGRFIVITARDHALTAELWIIPAETPSTEPLVISEREFGVDYSLSDDGDRFLILTNADGAEDYKIVETPLATPERACWRDVVSHKSGRMIRGLLLFQKYFVRLESVNALPQIIIQPLSGEKAYTIDFEEEVYDLGVSRGFEYETEMLRFTYSSLTTPQRTFDFDMNTRERKLRKEQEIPSGHDPNQYITHRIMATSHDGTMVPATLLHHKDTPIDGTAPLVLYGYGAYGVSIPASFSPNRFSLVDRGFIYAIAHTRGGADLGFQWYREGKLEKKENTFRDYISVGEALIGQNFTSLGRIVTYGGSAGGMLVGAALNMRPELFGAAVGEVPFVDVLNTMCDETLPLTPPEWVEWGNPGADPEAYRLIKSYSPYDNVTARNYPPILATAGISDPRVTYWEPAKWVARLREVKTDSNPVMLHINMDAGHGGATGRFDRLQEVALTYSFILRSLGKHEEPTLP
jgi:oligopeptidase B